MSTPYDNSLTEEEEEYWERLADAAERGELIPSSESITEAELQEILSAVQECLEALEGEERGNS